MPPSSRGYSTRQTPDLTFDRRHIGPIITAHAQGPTQITSELDAGGSPLGSVNREVPGVLFLAGLTDGFDACRQRTRFRAERIVVTRSFERFVIHFRVFGKYFTNFTGSWQCAGCIREHALDAGCGYRRARSRFPDTFREGTNLELLSRSPAAMID